MHDEIKKTKHRPVSAQQHSYVQVTDNPNYQNYNCDRIFEKRSKLHISSFEIKNSSQHNLPRITSMCMKFT